MRGATVLATGPLAVIEDLGRTGGSGSGVGRSGAADRGALRQGNRAVGNEEGAAAVEVTFGGLSLRVGDEPLGFCVSGAVGEVRVDDRGVGSHTVGVAPAGSTLTIEPPRLGLRSYLCLRGGVDVPPVLGSRSRDVLAGLGPAPLSEGDELPVGAAYGELPGVDNLPWLRQDEVVVVRAVRGPRDDWLADADVLVRSDWQVSDRSNRVGIRLSGATLERGREGELPSEGAWRGAVQVPPGGEPVLFLADHPVTGGYPVVAVVVDEDVDRLAQLQPGQSLRLEWVSAP